MLFDLATARLIEAKVLLPGASVLARAVAAARDRAAARLYRTLAEAPAPTSGAAVSRSCWTFLRASSSRVWSGCAPGRAS